MEIYIFDNDQGEWISYSIPGVVNINQIYIRYSQTMGSVRVLEACEHCGAPFIIVSDRVEYGNTGRTRVCSSGNHVLKIDGLEDIYANTKALINKYVRS